MKSSNAFALQRTNFTGKHYS